MFSLTTFMPKITRGHIDTHSEVTSTNSDKKRYYQGFGSTGGGERSASAFITQ